MTGQPAEATPEPGSAPPDPYRPHRLTTPTPNYSAKLVSHDRDKALRILREGFFCHIGYYDSVDGVVRVIPRQYGLADNETSLYLHGPRFHPTVHAEPPITHSSRLYELVLARKVTDVCVTVSLVDALALSDTAVHGALSYRSAVVYGKASVVTDTSPDGEVATALRTITDHVAPGYSDASRPADQGERDLVGIIRIDFEHVSSKARAGGPSLDKKKQESFWAGVVPIRQVYGPPITAKDSPVADPPDYVVRLVGGRGANPLVLDPPPHSTDEERPEGAPLI